ncbi:MAG TPA: cysteine-rich CWC family protein [Burkholderiales bacterium]|nr:cysteine-rich CWC family protein [Burkholderiales bacterium]
MDPEPVATDARPLCGDVCARCGATFECGMKAGVERCWCADLPRIAPDGTLAGCLCPRCLKEQVAQRGAAR